MNGTVIYKEVLQLENKNTEIENIINKMNDHLETITKEKIQLERDNAKQELAREILGPYAHKTHITKSDAKAIFNALAEYY